jgi:hypothetical protein
VVGNGITRIPYDTLTGDTFPGNPNDKNKSSFL